MKETPRYKCTNKMQENKIERRSENKLSDIVLRFTKTTFRELDVYKDISRLPDDFPLYIAIEATDGIIAISTL